MNTAQEFWSNVATRGPRECWLWLRADRKGYGAVYWRGKNWTAHRVAFVLSQGHKPSAHVLHHCDVSLCVNPAHLYEGTQRDNMNDRKIRGRANTAKGENAGKAKLTRKQVDVARYLHAQLGVSVSQLSELMGVTPSNVHAFLNFKSFK